MNGSMMIVLMIWNVAEFRETVARNKPMEAKVMPASIITPTISNKCSGSNFNPRNRLMMVINKPCRTEMIPAESIWPIEIWVREIGATRISRIKPLEISDKIAVELLMAP